MNKVTVLFLLTTAWLFSLKTHAQNVCTPENKRDLYAEFLKLRTADQPKAYDQAVKYLGCPQNGEISEAEQKVIDYLRKFTTAYDHSERQIKLRTLLYDDRKYADAFELGRQILAADPDNIKVLVHLGANGYLVASDPQLKVRALHDAQKALQFIGAGKIVDDWAPLQGKDVAVAYLNFTIGTLTIDENPSGAVKNLIKAAQFETPLKKSPFTYAYIAGAYETGPYLKQSEEFRKVYTGKDETPESKAALASINQLVDRMIDGYARAVALAGNDPKFAKQKLQWQERLTTWYKYRHDGSEAGMTELISGIIVKPLPPELP